jgi:hypothetical protein
MKWKSNGYIILGTIQEGNLKKASTLEYRKTTLCELIQYLKPKFQAFVVHNYVASW